MTDGRDDALTHRHLRWGWWLLLVFLSLGILLEALHGLKVGWYLDLANGTRRHMFTLAHAHGTLMGLLHIAFAATVRVAPHPDVAARGRAARLLTAAGLLLPGGFLLGGLFIYAGDPGLGILLVPVGALCLLASVWITVRGLRSP